MKAIIALIFLITLFVKISLFAQESNDMIQDRLVSDTKQVSEMVDLYFEEMIDFNTRLKNTPLEKQTSQDIEKANQLKEIRQTIQDVLRQIRAPIAEIANSPESLEVSENLKLQFNLALIKASLPRFETSKAASITARVFGSAQPQYVEEIISRTEASQLIFTEFATNEATKDGMNLNYRISEMTKAHNAIASKLNAAKNANVYHTYLTNLKITTATQEGALYEAIIKGMNFDVPAAKAKAQPAPPVGTEAPSTLQVTKEGPDYYKMIRTCFGLFAI